LNCKKILFQNQLHKSVALAAVQTLPEEEVEPTWVKTLSYTMQGMATLFPLITQYPVGWLQISSTQQGIASLPPPHPTSAEKTAKITIAL
jgi:hypothetical protein